MLIKNKVYFSEERVEVIVEDELAEVDEYMEVVRRYSGRRQQKSVDDAGQIMYVR